MELRPTTPEAGARPGRRTAKPSRRLGAGAAASLALHAGAAAAVGFALAWRAAPVAPAPDAALQVLWLDARPPAQPNADAPPRPDEPPREDALPAAPLGEAVAEGLEPEDLLATVLPEALPPPLPSPPDDAPPRPPEATVVFPGPPAPEIDDAPTEAEAAPSPRPAALVDEAAPANREAALAAPPLTAPPGSPVAVGEAAPADRDTAMAALPALPLPAPAPPKAPPPAATSPPPPARRDRPPRPERPPSASAPPPARPGLPPSPGQPLPGAGAGASDAAALVPSPPSAADRAPLIQGPPRFRRPPAPPEYPARARERGEEGLVGLRVLVGADGATREVRVHRSSGNRLLDEAALAAARRWEIEPPSVDGRRAEAWVEVPVRFRLER